MKKIKQLFLVALLFTIALTSCNNRIDAGHEGIKVKLYGTDKGIQDVNLVTGRVWYNPFTEQVFEFPVFIQTYDYPAFTVNAKDGSIFNVDPTLSFRVKAGNTPVIFAKYRKSLNEITETTLFNHIRDAFRIEFNKYTTDSIISNRASFEDRVQESISATLEKEGFEFEQMTSGIAYPPSITQAIDLKNKAVQEAIQVENELRVTEARAKKIVVQARAEAEANEIKEKTLTPLLIQQQFIEKWDGKASLYGQTPGFFKSVK